MFRTKQYRYANEQIVLTLTLFLVMAVVVLISTITFCLSGIFIVAMFAISWALIRSHHQSLLRGAIPVNSNRMPELARVVDECAIKLQPGPVETFIVSKRQLNAYTFGIENPKGMVLFQPLLRVMNAGELKFIIGHEMGHVALGHTWLNTIIGGMAGIPAPFGASVLLYSAFRWWNRMCEYSADRAGLLACGDLNLAIAALVKLIAPEVRTEQEFEQVLSMMAAKERDVSSRMGEVFRTHPMLGRRVAQLREFSQTRLYQELQKGVNQNITKVGMRGSEIAGEGEALVASPQSVEESEKTAEERWPWLAKK